jgi:hypothetical protein
MTVALVSLSLASLALALGDWRRSLLFCVLVGFVQDPIRKVLPSQPVQLVIAVAAAFVACLIGLYSNGDRLHLQRLLRAFVSLRVPVAGFVTIVVLQCVHTLVRTGSSTLAGLGLLSYLSPPLALLVGNRFCDSMRLLRLWLTVYLAGSFVVGGTVLLQFAGFEPVIFSAIGIEFVYGGSTGVVRMMSGIMRSSEIAAWHLAAGACLLIAVAGAARSSRIRWLALGGTMMLIMAVVLTGRRKMLAEIALFVVTYLFLVSQYRRGGSRIAQVAMSGLFLAAIALQLLGTRGQSLELAPYLGRGATVIGESTDRLFEMTISQLRWVVFDNGILGAGAGTGAQGSQYFGGGTDLVGGSAEGGLGKVLAELGVPGALALLWLGLSIGRVVLRIARFARKSPPSEALLLYGLIAFLPANAMVFLTAHQVFGDPFVLIILGLIAGSILAFPRICSRQIRPTAVGGARYRSGALPGLGRAVSA